MSESRLRPVQQAASLARQLGQSKFGQDVLWNVASLGILAVGGVLINAIIVRFRGTEALGIFNQVYAIYIVLSQVAVIGLQAAVLRQVSHRQDDLGECADLTLAALILVAVVSSLLAVVCSLLAGGIGDLLGSPGVGQGIRYIVPGLILLALNKVLINVLNGLRQMRAYAVFSSLRFVLIPVGVLVVSLLDMPAPALLLPLSAAEALLFVALVAFIQVRVFRFRLSRNVVDWLKPHLSFGLRGFLSGLLLELNTRVDVLMLGYFSTDRVVGVYSLASMLAEGVGQLPVAVRWNVDPLLGRHFAQGEMAQIGVLSRRVRRVLYPLMAAVGVVAVAAYPLVYALWVGDDQWRTSWSVFSIILIGVVINAGYKPFMGVLLQGGRPGAYTLFISGLVLWDALMNLMLIPLGGIVGAAVVTGLTYVLQMIVLIVLARRLFGIRL
ncbi:MAG: oligosaccharide flippase family protein [Anaerolineae bacterium]|nr:oligosaccharide flippase family protein [Anaerolineae bacterium]